MKHVCVTRSQAAVVLSALRDWCVYLEAGAAMDDDSPEADHLRDVRRALGIWERAVARTGTPL